MRPLLALLPLLLAACAAPERDRAIPAYEKERAVPSAALATEILHPFGHSEESTGRTSDGIRPLWRHEDTDHGERTEILYPLYRTVDDRGTVATRLFPLYWHDRMPTPAGIDSDTTVLPFLFWGTDPSEGSYFLLFPLGGVAKQKFNSDATTFVLFPLYAGTRTGTWRGHHVLWPLAHWGSDPPKKRDAFRVWPFYARHVKEGVYERYSALWPVVQWGVEDQDRKYPKTGWMIWPLFGRETSDEGYAATTVLWPLILWEDGPRTRERGLPFPLYRSRQEWSDRPEGRVQTVDMLWFWPFWGKYDRIGEQRRDFWLWPLGWSIDTVEPGGTEDFDCFAPFWRRVAHDASDGARLDSWWKIWPFASGGFRRDGTREWSALAPIPWFRWEEFDANWGVFFELARVREDPDGSRATDLLFSLVRSRSGPAGEHHRVPLLMRTDRTAEGSSWSILEGLLGGETAPDGGSSLRLLWFLRIPLR